MSSKYPVSYSVLSCEALKNTLQEDYGLDSIDQVSFFQAGLNDTYLVKQRTEQYILRVYRKDWRSLSDIQCEIDVLLHLKNKNVKVAVPIARSDEKYFTSIDAPEGNRYLVLFEYAQGDVLKFKVDDKCEAETYAQSMAAMHKALDSFSSPHQRMTLDLDYLLHKPLQTIKSFLAHRPDDCSFLDALAQEILTQFKLFSVNEPSYGFCHGDLNGGNAHLEKNELTLFDFDCLGEGYLAYDLAVFLWGVRLNKRHKSVWSVFLKSYQTKRELKSADLLLIPLFVGIRHFWHMGLHISLSKDRGKNWLDDQYFDQQLKFLKDWRAEYL